MTRDRAQAGLPVPLKAAFHLGGGDGGDEFVVGDFSRDAYAAVGAGIDAHNLSLAANFYVSAGNVFRKGNHEFDGTAGAKGLFGEKI